MGINKFVKIGDKMKKLRVESKLTQQEIANILNIPRSTYANYEKNTREPDEEFIESFCKVFNLHPFDLIYNVSKISNEVKDLEVFEKLLNYFGYKVNHVFISSEEEVPLEDETIELTHVISNNTKTISALEYTKFIDHLKHFIDFEFYNLKKQ